MGFDDQRQGHVHPNRYRQIKLLLSAEKTMHFLQVLRGDTKITMAVIRRR